MALHLMSAYRQHFDFIDDDGGWLWVDSNHRPQHYECRALTS